jgi:hypothetical protein
MRMRRRLAGRCRDRATPERHAARPLPACERQACESFADSLAAELRPGRLPISNAGSASMAIRSNFLTKCAGQVRRLRQPSRPRARRKMLFRSPLRDAWMQCWHGLRQRCRPCRPCARRSRNSTVHSATSRRNASTSSGQRTRLPMPRQASRRRTITPADSRSPALPTCRSRRLKT